MSDPSGWEALGGYLEERRQTIRMIQIISSSPVELFREAWLRNIAD